jgi:hypothetical protein
VAKYPILIYGDEAGSAELTPEQQDWMMKALWGHLRRRWSPRSGKSLGATPCGPQRRPPRVRTTPQASNDH